MGLWAPPAPLHPPVGPHLWTRRPSGLILPPLPRVPYPFLAVPTLAQAAITSSVSAASSTVAFGSNVTSGNIILVVVAWDNNNSNVPAITRSSGTATIGAKVTLSTTANTKNASAGAGGGSANVALFAVSVTGTGSLTLSVAVTGVGFLGWTATEWSGLTTSLDGAQPANTNNIDAGSVAGPWTVTAGNVVTSAANSLICGMSSDDGGSSGSFTGTAGSTYTIVGSGVLTGYPSWMTYKVANAGTYTPNHTISGGGWTTTSTWKACIGALALQAAASSTVTPPRPTIVNQAVMRAATR